MDGSFLSSQVVARVVHRSLCNMLYDCKLGGFRIIQHNEVRDLLAEVMREAGYVVEKEPRLQSLAAKRMMLAVI
jgi:hypothetical protein